MDDALGHRPTHRDGPDLRSEARWLLKRMAECAWHCGDPGVQYDTTINRWHTCPNSRPHQCQQSVQRVHVPG